MTVDDRFFTKEQRVNPTVSKLIVIPTFFAYLIIATAPLLFIVGFVVSKMLTSTLFTLPYSDQEMAFLIGMGIICIAGLVGFFFLGWRLQHPITPLYVSSDYRYTNH